MLSGVTPNERLNAYLEAREWSAAEFARRCGTSRQRISQILHGGKPGIWLALTIAKRTRGKGGPIRPEDWK